VIMFLLAVTIESLILGFGRCGGPALVLIGAGAGLLIPGGRCGFGSGGRLPASS
jgi:hypothetical protein